MKNPSWQITKEKYYAQKLDDKYGMSYELYVQQMADEGKIVLPFGKEPYVLSLVLINLPREISRNISRGKQTLQPISRGKQTLFPISRGEPINRSVDEANGQTYEMNRKEFYKYVDAGYHPEIGKRNPKEMLQDVDKYGRRKAERRWTIEYALAKGKSVPMKVLQDYPDLLFAKMDVRPVSFNSHTFVCYGKPTKRGLRAYCRRK